MRKVILALTLVILAIVIIGFATSQPAPVMTASPSPTAANLVTVQQRYFFQTNGLVRDTEFKPIEVSKNSYILQDLASLSDVFKELPGIRAVYCNRACVDYVLAGSKQTAAEVIEAQEKALKNLEFLIEMEDGSFIFLGPRQQIK